MCRVGSSRVPARSPNQSMLEFPTRIFYLALYQPSSSLLLRARLPADSNNDVVRTLRNPVKCVTHLWKDC
jgi:hypothetical protein